MGKGLPNFDNPPLSEVALSVQFQPLENFKSAHIGLLWEKFRSDFPLVEEHGPLEPQFERFGIRRTSAVPFKLEMMDRPPTPRCWFVKEDGSQLIQIQRDRFINNWRKRGEGTNYPRYEAIRDLFEEELVAFASFAGEELLGQLHFNQCEITYVNEIEPNGVWDNHSQLNRILTVFTDSSGEQGLPKLENANLRARFLLEGDEGKPIGRLHVNVEPRHRVDSGKPIYFMTLTARGTPSTSDVEGIMQFLDYGRQVVVKSFTSLTSKEMHAIWEGPHD